MGAHPVARKEGADKVTGRARYIDDITMPDMLYGVTVRSSTPRGRITAISGIPPECIVVTAADIPSSGTNEILLLTHDQPCLAGGVINHPQEPVLLLAHEDKYLLERARSAVRIEVDPLPANFNME